MMKLLMEESGQGLAEYALILAFVFLAVLTALGALGNSLQESFIRTTELFD